MPSGALWTSPGKVWLIVVAAPAEGAAVLRGRGVADVRSPDVRWSPIDAGPGFQLLVTGVGKACAAGAIASVIRTAPYAGVISMGLCGALPASALSGVVSNSLAIGSAIVASLSIYGDEGVPTPDDRFTDIATLGFAPNVGLGEEPSIAVHGDETLRAALRPLADADGVIATVSECSGTDSRAALIAARTGAVAEAMEGAAIGFTLRRLVGRHVPFAELRVVSNTTGDRTRQVWDARAALSRLEDLVRRL